LEWSLDWGWLLSARLVHKGTPLPALRALSRPKAGVYSSHSGPRPAGAQIAFSHSMRKITGRLSVAIVHQPVTLRQKTTTRFPRKGWNSRESEICWHRELADAEKCDKGPAILWLGGRGSNPDRQIQSFSRADDATGNQQLSPANSEQAGQNPQPPRNPSSFRNVELPSNTRLSMCVLVQNDCW